MLLAIDVGNTMTDFGLFSGDELSHFYRIHSRKDMTVEEALAALSLYLGNHAISPADIDGAIIASVVPSLQGVYEELCLKGFGLTAKVVGPGLKTGLKVNTDNPKEVGADLIAETVAAKEKFGSCTLIADFGTATKVILLDKEGAFAGCVIGAGIGLQEKSLSTSASLLPEVSMQIPPKILGKNTHDSMNSFLTYGSAFAVKSLCDGLEAEAGYPCRRVLTGGFAKGLLPLFPEFAYEPHLVLSGLASIYRRNVK